MPVHLFNSVKVNICLLLISLAWTVDSKAATIEIFARDSFETAVEALNPGDTLIVHEGTYIDSGRISVTVKGTAFLPVMIKAAENENRPHITRNLGDAAQNTINIEGATYLTITGLEISSNGGDAINLNSNPSYITLENLEIHDVDVGINFRSSMHHIIARDNHIHHLGLDDGSGTGEGMYVGCNNATCVVSDSLMENNWIHHTVNSSQGDGIEIKRGSHSNIIRNNIIHDTGYPCILVYGTEGNPKNIVERNKMWNCGDSVIQAAADVIIRNNIMIAGDSDGFNSQDHQGVTPNNLEFVHNTLIGGNPCLRLYSWNDKTGLVIANNAIYCLSENYMISGVNGATVSGNVLSTGTSSLPASGYTLGRSEALDFVNISDRNVYPTSDSSVLNTGDPSYGVSDDYTGTTRSGVPDAGAYDWTAASATGDVVINFSASPGTVESGSTALLSWTTSYADSCEASGDWSGSKNISGSEQVGPLAADSTFVLTCAGTNNSNVKTITVTVISSTGRTGDSNATGDENTGGTGGGGGGTTDDSTNSDGTSSGSDGGGALNLPVLFVSILIFGFLGKRKL